jgi:hypothetical protein
MPAYPRGFLTTFWLVLALLFATGFVLTPGALELRLEWELPLRLPGGSRILVAAAHAFAAFASLLVIGALIPLHMRSGLRRQRSVVTGIGLLVLFGLLAISGLAIYYVSSETWSVWSSISHLGVGITLAVPLAVHVIKGRRIRRSRSA